MDTLRLPAKMESLQGFYRFVEHRARQCGLSGERLLKLELVLEELLTNAIQYAYQSQPGDLEVRCFLRDPVGFCLSIQDWGCPFNPLLHNPPDLSRDACERPVGGLGIHLVRLIVDTLDYQRTADSNIVTVCFKVVAQCV
jgi:serine/threonine-protein kinase RsbW